MCVLLILSAIIHERHHAWHACAAHKHRCRCRGDPVDRIVAIDGPARTLVALESLTLFIPAGGTPAVGEDLSRFRAEWVAAVDVRRFGGK
jgi:hypothetical protein